MLVSIQKLQNKEAQVSSNTTTKRSPTKEKKNTKHTPHDNIKFGSLRKERRSSVFQKQCNLTFIKKIFLVCCVKKKIKISFLNK